MKFLSKVIALLPLKKKSAGVVRYVRTGPNVNPCSRYLSELREKHVGQAKEESSRYDDIYYTPSDKTKQTYQQTWSEPTEPVKKSACEPKEAATYIGMHPERRQYNAHPINLMRSSGRIPSNMREKSTDAQNEQFKQKKIAEFGFGDVASKRMQAPYPSFSERCKGLLTQLASEKATKF